MSIYLKIPNLQGNVSVQNYKNWIQIHGLNFSVRRSVSQLVGRTNDRNTGYPMIRQIAFSKHIDKSSNAFLSNALTGKALGTAEVHVCSTGQSLSPYAKYVFSNVMVSKFDEILTEDGMPFEHIILSFTQLQKTYIHRNEAQEAQAPNIVGYNLETGQLL